MGSGRNEDWAELDWVTCGGTTNSLHCAISTLAFVGSHPILNAGNESRTTAAPNRKRHHVVATACFRS